MRWGWIVACIIGGNFSYQVLQGLGLELDGLVDFAAYFLAVTVYFALGWIGSDQ